MECYQIALSLLDVCKSEPRSEFIPYALAAIDYFIQEEDANPDFSSLDGFEDDKEVLLAVISHFNLEDKLKNFSTHKGA